MNLNFQLALPKELEEVFSHFQKVIFHMQSSGLDQWDQVYPDLETLREDIQKNDLYLARIKEQIAVVFVLNQEMDAFSKNQAAMKLYQSLGFWETGYAHWRKGTFILLEKDI